MRLRAWIVVSVWLVTVSLAAAVQDPPLEAVCLKMDRIIDGLLGVQISRCLPSKGKTTGQYSFFFLAKKPVLHDAANRRAWVMAIVGAVGTAMTETRDFPEMRGVSIDEILTIDSDFAKQNKALVFPAPLAKRIRNGLYTGNIHMDQAYEQIKAAIDERVMK